MIPAARAPAPAIPVGEAPLGDEVAATEEAELATPLVAEEMELEMPEAAPPLLEEAGADDDGRAEVVEPPEGLAVAEPDETEAEIEAVLVVVMAPVGIPEVALEFKHESLLPCWMTVGLEYWGLPSESVIRKVTLEPAGRSGVQVRPPAGRSLPMKAIAGAETCPAGITSTM